MFFYLILITCVLIFSGVLFRRGSKSGYVFVSLLLTVIACIRFDVGWDYPSYYRALDETFLPILMHFEPLSLVICMPSLMTGNPFLFFIISGLIIYPLAFYAFKKNSVFPALSLVIYVGLFYLISCSIVRQAIAVSICLYAYKYVVRRSFSKYLLCIVIAVLFHYSSAVALVIYPVYHWLKIKHVILGLIAAVVLRNALFAILATYGLYDDYLSNLNDIEGGAMTRYFYMLVFFSFFFLIKYKGYTPEEKKMFSIILIGLFSPYLLGSAMGERIGYYFLIYYCYLIPLLLQNRKVYKRVLYAFISTAYFLAMIFITSNIDGQKSAYTPYQTIFTSNIVFKN